MIIGLRVFVSRSALGYLFAFPLHFGAAGVISGWMCGMLIGAIIYIIDGVF